MPPRPDVAVCGAGPAGLTLAVELAERGVAVTLHDGRADTPWRATYGLWESELVWGLPLAARWPAVTVHATTTRTLDRGYAVVDTAAWQAALRRRARDAGVRVVAEHVASPPPGRVVVDATGHRPALVRVRPHRPAWQTAYGLRVRTDVPPADGPVFMDWRGSPREQPSFLYALPYPDGSWLLEETVLAARPAVPLSVLRERLLARFPGLTGDEERVAFPMTATVPRAQPLLAFGAAAGMVNPASGFHLGWALARAAPLADLLAGGAPPEACWAMLWPAEERRRQRLLLMGLETLLTWDGPRLTAFFEAFFALDDDRVAQLLTRSGSPLPVMAQTWRHADAATRRSLVAGVRHLR